MTLSGHSGADMMQEGGVADLRQDILSGIERKADPKHSALIVIDVQNDFAADGGFFDSIGADVNSIQHRTLPALRRLIAGARAAGTPVVFVQAIYDDEHLSGPMRERNATRKGVLTGRSVSGRVEIG